MNTTDPLSEMAASVNRMKTAAAKTAGDPFAELAAQNVTSQAIGNTGMAAAAGAGIGAVGGALLSEKDKRLRGALLGLLVGGGLGAAGGAAHGISGFPGKVVDETLRMRSQVAGHVTNQVPGADVAGAAKDRLLKWLKGGELTDADLNLVEAFTFQKLGFVPSPQTQAAMEQQIAQQASQQAQAQAQGAPPAMRMEDLAQMIDGGFQQLGQAISQILAMLQSGQLVMQMMQQQAGLNPACAGGGGGEEKGEGEEKKSKKSEGEGGGGGGEGGGGAAPAAGTPPAAAQGGGNIEQRVGAMEQMLQQLVGGAGGGMPAPAPMGGGMMPPGAPPM